MLQSALMTAKHASPSPIFDNLDYLADPFKQKNITVKAVIPVGMDSESISIDYEYAWKFIYSYNGSSATFNVYRREVERLLHWSWLINQSSILELKREDIEAYVKFCIKPPKNWIGLKQVSRFKNKNGQRVLNPDWHPFVTKVSKIDQSNGVHPDKKDFVLSQPSIQSIFSVLSSFYNYLIQEQVTDSNPVMLIRQKSKFVRKAQQHAPVRRISNLQWDYVIETVEKMAVENPSKYERSLFIMNCLLGMYLRISELVADERSTPVMGDFRKDIDNHWWFHVIGKGNKSRIVTVSDDMIKALKRYRKFLGLTVLPVIGEAHPLIKKNIGQGSITSTRQIRSIVQACFNNAYERMKLDGLKDDAEELKLATVHWLRHTGISEDVKHRPREHVRDDAGHSSMQTTDRYIDSDARERHASGRNKKIKG